MHTPDLYDGRTYDDLEEEGDIEAARALVASGAPAELFLYPGDRHLFVDESLPSFDAIAAALVKERVLAFLATC